jgi:hypothetical protein
MDYTLSTIQALAVEVDLTQSQPLLIVYPVGDTALLGPTGTKLMHISSRPFFVPLTQQEASLVLEVLRTEAVYVQLPFLGSDQRPYTIIDQRSFPKKSAS